MRRFAFYGIYAVLLILVLALIARRPVAFQKSSAISEAPYEKLEVSSAVFDVQPFISSIPYSEQSVVVYEVEPRKKFQRTVVEGYGNCSNLVFGTAHFLRQRRIPFHIVHILPQREFLNGQGHTLLYANCKWNDGVSLAFVDMLEGGIPVHRGGRPISMHDLETGHLQDLSIVSLSEKHDTLSVFYGEMLDRSTIGLIQGRDVERYFHFLERFALPLGSGKVEKMIYDGVAVLLGIYPKIRVASIDATFRDVSKTRWFYLALLWFLRASAIVLPLLAIIEVRRACRAPQSTLPSSPSSR